VEECCGLDNAEGTIKVTSCACVQSVDSKNAMKSAA
jgi:hypothetical protein